MNKSSRKTELLAPAGSLEAFFAAIEFGADAVYCGLTEFSARARAKNFSLADVEKMTAYAHGQNRQLYVALNTLIKEDELPRLIDVLAGLSAIKVDGLIIQDMGVWRLARRFFPELKLHASTQMTVHNSAGVKMLEGLGFSRAVLARELTLTEITAIRSRTTIELEHFVHGALCFSVSGLCLFSSFLNGASGNRGRCVQPCRRRYTCREKTGYYLSTSDLCAIDLLPQLIDAGIMSLKIEGRMKSAEYVARVVTAYRLALDAAVAERRAALAKAKEILKLSYGREPTKGFLTGFVPTGLSLPDRQGSIGRLLGRIKAIHDKTISFQTAEALHLGDRLRILPQNDLEGTGFTITELFIDNRSAKAAKAGALVRIPVPANASFHQSDSIYKVQGEQLFTMSEDAGQRKLAHVKPQPVSVRLRLSCSNETLTITGETQNITVEQTYPVTTIQASHQPLSVETLSKVFNRTGDTPFILEKLAADTLASVIIHPGRLKEIRRDFYQHLALTLADAKQKKRDEQRTSALTALLKEHPPATSDRDLDIVIAAAGWRDVTFFDILPKIRIVLPLTPAIVRDFDRAEQHPQDLTERLIWDLPTLIFENELAEYRGVIRRLSAQGFSRFRLNNLGHFSLFNGLSGVNLCCGFKLYATNSQAALVWHELGAIEISTSLEDDRENIQRIINRETGIPARVTVYSAIPLLVSRIPIRDLAPDVRMKSDNEELFRIQRQDGLTLMTATSDFSLIGRLEELRAAGGGNRILVDLSHLGLHSQQGRKVLHSLEHDESVPETTVFNFDRGLR